MARIVTMVSYFFIHLISLRARLAYIVLSTDDLAIPPFKDYFNSASDKKLALQEIEYIIWLYKWNTPYEAYPEKERA